MATCWARWVLRVEHLDNLTSLLRSGDQRVALAVMLRESESAEAGSARFNSLSPISYALKKADDENLSLGNFDTRQPASALLGRRRCRRWPPRSH